MDNISGVKPTAFGKGPLMLVGWSRQEDRLSISEGTTFIDFPGTDRDMYIKADQDTIQLNKGLQNPVVTLTYKGEDIVVHKAGTDFDIRIIRDENGIKVDRKGTTDDVAITKRGTLLMVDREGTDNDVRISSNKGDFAFYPLYVNLEGEIIEQV